MSQGIAVHDADLDLIAFNQQYIDLLDYPLDFIRLGMPFEEIARFKAERGDYGDGDPEELLRERLAPGNLMKPDRKEIATARGLIGLDSGIVAGLGCRPPPRREAAPRAGALDALGLCAVPPGRGVGGGQSGGACCWWAILDSNQGPQSYQDCALTS